LFLGFDSQPPSKSKNEIEMTNGSKMVSAIMCSLKKIEQQNNYMIQLLEAMSDDALLVAELQNRIKKTNQTIRELEYEQWFEQKQKLKKEL
jgi:hypothetical protein